MPRRSMETRPIRFQELFEDEDQYHVPLFQRNYNWEKDNVIEFWDDLWKHWDNWRNRREERISYYFGSLMLVNDDETTFNFKVVDGQQRLTTSMVFFIAIRDYFLQIGEDDEVKELNSIINYEDENGNLKPRLTLNRYTRDYFRQTVVKEGKIGEKINTIGTNIRVGNKELAECYKEIAGRIIDDDGRTFGSITQEDKIREIRSLYEHLLRNFEVVRNIFADKQRAYRVFETINHKGLNLDENDLVKNYLLEHIDIDHTIDESQDVIDADKKWGDIGSLLEQLKLKEDFFLRTHLTAFYERTPKEKIYERVMGIVGDKIRAESFLDELQESANYLSKIKKPTLTEWHDDTEVVDNLQGLDAIASGAFYPVLLAAAKDRFSFAEMKKLIEIVTKLHFRAKTICGVSFTEIESLVVKMCTKLRSGTYSIPEIIQEVTGWSKYPSDDEFKLKFMQREAKTSKVAKYVLKEIEFKMLGGRSIAGRILLDVEIEHIMPKSIEDTEWFTMIKSKTENGTAPEINDYHQRNLHRLGNLTLLAKVPNAIIQNDSFSKKLNGSGGYTGYRDDLHRITKGLRDYPEWDEDQISIRQTVFLTHALHIWNLNPN